MLTLLRGPATRFALVGFVVLCIQTTIVTDLKPFGATADLMLLGATSAGVAGGAQRGALAGFIYGFLFDLVLVSPFGISPLVYGLAGFMAGYVHTITVDPTWWLSSLAVAASSAAGVIGVAFVGTFVGLDGLIHPDLVKTAIVVGVINGLLAPLVMPVQRWCTGVKRVVHT
jgi:rod shape-determining protein MreD